MKSFYFLNLFSFLLFVIACNTTPSTKPEIKNKSIQTDKTVLTNPVSSKGYQLMKQKCFICHMEKPDSSKKSLMLAPPISRVLEHYKPSYPEKDQFIKAITTWVNNPKEENTLMPGAVRKFKLMPKLSYSSEDLSLIASTLYDMDFGAIDKPNKMTSAKLSLNQGKKWVVNEETKSIVHSISKRLEEFDSNTLKDYHQLGSAVFDSAKTILLDTSYTKETFDQLHLFFNNIEENIHLLIAAPNLDYAKEQKAILIKKFHRFNNYFE